MFEGLIKALRASKTSEDAVIKTALADISKEVKSSDWDVKAGAVLKLTYVRLYIYYTYYRFPKQEWVETAGDARTFPFGTIQLSDY